MPAFSCFPWWLTVSTACPAWMRTVSHGFGELFSIFLFLNRNITKVRHSKLNSAVPYSLCHSAFQLNFPTCNVKITFPDWKTCEHMQGYVGHCTAMYLKIHSQQHRAGQVATLFMNSVFIMIYPGSRIKQKTLCLNINITYNSVTHQRKTFE